MHNHLHEIKSKTAIITLIVNIILASSKVITGRAISSVSLVSEAIHTTLDVLSSIITILGIKLSINYDKAEKLSAIFEIFLIYIAGFWISWETYNSFVQHNHVSNPPLAIIVLSLSLIVNSITSVYLFRQVEQTKSAALFGNANHFLTDIVIDSITLLGFVIIYLTGWTIVDIILSGLMAVLILLIAVRSTIKVAVY